MLRELLRLGLHMYEMNTNGEIAVGQIFNQFSDSTLQTANYLGKKQYTTPTSFLIRLLFKDFHYDSKRACSTVDGMPGLALQDILM